MRFGCPTDEWHPVKPYATDAPERKVAPLVIALCAVALAYVAHWLLLTIHWDVEWYIDFPSSIALYGLLFWAFDRAVWKLRVGSWRLSVIPDLSGSWTGTVTSSHDRTVTHQCECTIKQTWSNLSVTFETDQSRSTSTWGALLTEDSSDCGLMYGYLNEPTSSAASSMHAHRGYATLRWTIDFAKLEGEYFTGRDRRTSGDIHLAIAVRK